MSAVTRNFPDPIHLVLGWMDEINWIDLTKFSKVSKFANRGLGIRGLFRPGDIRASGSGRIAYRREDLDEHWVSMGFETTDKHRSSCSALNVFYDQNRQTKILELSYGFMSEGYDACEAYWGRDLTSRATGFYPQAWIVEKVHGSIARTTPE